MQSSCFEAKVRDISIEGYGVLDHPVDGVFFCMGVFPGDVGTFEIYKKKDRYGFARLIELKELSPQRRRPPCQHSGIGPKLCGGCPWMPLDYAVQLDLKRKILMHNLKRLRLIDDEFQLNEVVPSPLELGYRNRAQFKTNGIEIGFMSRFSKDMAPVQECPILNEKMSSHLEWFKSQLPNPAWTPPPGKAWSYLEVDDEMRAQDVKLNTRAPFRQGNSLQNQFMKDWLQNTIATLPKEIQILELFCGSGNFTEVFLKNKFLNLIAVDIAGTGLSHLQEKFNGQLNAVSANLFMPSDWKKIKSHTKKVDLIFLDPPREGFEKLSLFAEQMGHPQHVLYVSCDMASFVKDIWLLGKKGYVLKSIVAIDQFPHTPYMEILSVLSFDSNLIQGKSKKRVGPTKQG